MKHQQDYIAQVDSVKAPDALKARLLALQGEFAEEAAQSEAMHGALFTAQSAPTAPRKTAKRAIPFALPQHWQRYALTAAACFAIGVLSTGGTSFLNMASQDFATTTGTANSTTAHYALDTTAETSAMPETSDTTANIDAAQTADTARIISEDSEAAETAEAAENTDTTRQIIYTASLTLETKDYDATLAALESAVSESGGYLSYSEHRTYASSERYSTLSYRIPASDYQSFMSTTGTLGNVCYLNEYANDVTTQYIDLQAYITALSSQRERLLALQAEAQDLDDLLAIESELTAVQYQLDSYEGQLNYLADQVAYATITITLEEVVDYTSPELTFFEKVANAFSAGLTSFANSIASAILWMVSMFAWLIAFGCIAIAIVLYRRKRKAKNG